MADDEPTTMQFQLSVWIILICKEFEPRARKSDELIRRSGPKVPAHVRSYGIGAKGSDTIMIRMELDSGGLRSSEFIWHINPGPQKNRKFDLKEFVENSRHPKTPARALRGV